MKRIQLPLSSEQSSCVQRQALHSQVVTKAYNYYDRSLLTGAALRSLVLCTSGDAYSPTFLTARSIAWMVPFRAEDVTR